MIERSYPCWSPNNRQILFDTFCCRFVSLFGKTKNDQNGNSLKYKTVQVYWHYYAKLSK